MNEPMNLPDEAPVVDLNQADWRCQAQAALRPVVLADGSERIGIFFTPAHWQKLEDHLEDLQARIDLLEIDLAEARGEIEYETLGEKSFEEWLNAEAVPA